MARGDATLRNLTLTGAGYDRRADRRREPDLIDECLDDPATQVLELRAGRAPIRSQHDGCEVLWRAPQPDDRARLSIYLGESGGAPEGERAAYLAVIEDGADDGEGARQPFRGLREVAADLNADDAALFATSLALANWHRTHQFCPGCGGPTVAADAGWTRRCTREGTSHFPRTDPAVIMSVTDADDRLLLARGSGFRASGMSVLAGFLEPGESLAEAVRREVWEEVGLRVDDVTYLGDQPWPFPTGVMVGFTAQATSTELTLQDDEIQSAQWFTRAELASALEDGTLAISGRLSIARRLIEHWYGAPLKAPEVSLRG